MSTPPSEPPRIFQFRTGLARRIPRFPNSAESLQHLLSESLTTTLVHYLSWADRFVMERPRRVVIEDTVRRHDKWPQLQESVSNLLSKASNGEPIWPHLSELVFRRGVAIRGGFAANRWEDKDQLLNTMGFYHFHLGTTTTSSGMVSRTKELLFAEVTRDEFIALAIADHEVFAQADSEDGSVNHQRQWLWQLALERKSRDLPPGAAFMPYMISSSGHKTAIVFSAIHFARVVQEIDPKLDDPAYRAQLYENAGVAVPNNRKLKWALNHMDLGLVDANRVFFTLAYCKV